MQNTPRSTTKQKVQPLPPLDLVPHRAGLFQRIETDTGSTLLTCKLARGRAGPGRDGDPGPRAGKECGSASELAPSTRAAARIFPASTHVARSPAPVGPVAPIWWLQTPHRPRRVAELPDPGTAPPRSMLSANRLESFLEHWHLEFGGRELRRRELRGSFACCASP